MTLLVFITSLLGAMAIGVPVAFALMFCGVTLMWYMGMFNSQIIAQNMIAGADTFTLLAIPFFVLAGELMNSGGLSRRIIEFAIACVGHIRGGLGIVAIMAAVIMASISGSAAADTAALAAILIPMMAKAGYNVPRSAGLIASGGIIAPVIPPSMAFIVFGVAANVSITQLFMAGIVPGMLMGIALVIAWQIVVRKDNVKPLPKAPAKERLRATGRAAWALGMPVIILGGIKAGVVTPTEAAVIAAAYAMFVGMVIYRELKPRDLPRVILQAAKTTSIIMFLVCAALVSAWLITAANIPGEITRYIEPLIDRPMLLMFVIMALVLVVGTALDLTPTILILTPVLMPIIKQAGIDPVYFGVMFIMNCCIGLITPPVGVVLNVVSGVGRVPLGKVVTGIVPFLLAQVLVLVLLVIFPEIVIVPAQWLR
ncbi:MAG: TRAP transporter large permease subunit [Alphaproteobacteria bacterium]|jgi:tripartite ATP-independent transporter DctM subunit|uniref:TRAP transporter large permease n=1 Tax=unclassified Rhizobium TaxID=2613769 RepID=UPI0006B999ED|nr:TRAP transporter large permease subunit [Rhizobium sp. AAP116]MBU0736938.1 TRAP transporter large permease subunit [Alphaproteobacteria bacterium]MDM7982069.1 TRAP transporter large permease subunit [Rhizobium sp.]KPF60129.1 L-dehydroascorbate transporter large permease subunit [Rhizobium sp. AAP116]MBU0831809.1 TRAP transporter large permease subunit [Alphaproteobacteria bacterium]MBU1765678.1 TRAP transporter large permease subunit [Alphaproteobacteria bacterium]